MENHFGSPADNSDDQYPVAHFPPAPMPLHERQWRHPSELGFVATVDRPHAPIDIGRRGRGLVVFSCLAGSILVVSLLLALTP